MKLEIGSGYNPTPGYVHLDANPNAPCLDYLSEAFPLTMLADASFEEVRAVDVLEHISYRDTAAALTEWVRVLEPAGLIYVQVPDAETIMRQFVRAPHALIDGLPADLPQTALAGAAWRLLGGHQDDTYVNPNDDWRWNAHYALFSRDSLGLALRTAGLIVQRIEQNQHPNLLAWAMKP